jgi:hypothetical protein
MIPARILAQIDHWNQNTTANLPAWQSLRCNQIVDAAHADRKQLRGLSTAVLEDDEQRPRKQRHTAKWIFERLRAEHSYTGGYTIVKD